MLRLVFSSTSYFLTRLLPFGDHTVPVGKKQGSAPDSIFQYSSSLVTIADAQTASRLHCQEEFQKVKQCISDTTKNGTPRLTTHLKRPHLGLELQFSLQYPNDLSVLCH